MSLTALEIHSHKLPCFQKSRLAMKQHGLGLSIFQHLHALLILIACLAHAQAMENALHSIIINAMKKAMREAVIA